MEEKVEYTQEEKIKAAYALNLCTVSVSQIIDYNDLEILEQEYEMILNNLNLENMPKDEALLNILKQILDIVTFFRIQDVDKKFIEKEYQVKMKNAIWSAVPNFGLIVAGGNPITMGISLASQIGIGYMNYRKARANNKLEADRAYWQLQRAAIEQLNGLRRELFDTAWRMADEYNFPDEYRLTEKQIAQYNNILMDTDPFRRYERLYAIKDKFCAYIPFWYQMGNTANEISQKIMLSKNTRATFRETAKECFEKFITINNKNILRDDQIAAACALEYIDLLDVDNDKEKINKLIQIAENNAGGSYDILELCGVAYLKIGNNDRAVSILRQLVNEDYNKIMNAQILSNIYVSNFVYKINPEQSMADYEMLETRVPKEFLFPKIEDGIYNIDKLNSDFCEKQKKILRIKYDLVLGQFIKKYTIQFNKIFPVPDENREYTDTYFLDGEVERTKRMEDYDELFGSENNKVIYCNRLNDGRIAYKFFDVINDMYEGVQSLHFINDRELLEMILAGGIVANKDAINAIISMALDNNIDELSTEVMFSISFKDIVYSFFKELHTQITDYIDKIGNMNQISIADTILRQLCNKENLDEPDSLYANRKNAGTKILKKFTHKLLGMDYKRLKEISEKKQEFREIAEQHTDRIITGIKTDFLLCNTTEFDNYFKKVKDINVQKIKSETIAVIDDNGLTDLDIMLTYQGLAILKHNRFSEIIEYNNLKLDGDSIVEIENRDKKISKATLLAVAPLLVGAPVVAGAAGVAINKMKNAPFKYKNKNVNINELFSLIQEFDRKQLKDDSYNGEMKKEFIVCDNYNFLYTIDN